MNVYQWMLQFSRTGGAVLPVSGLSLNIQENNGNILLTWKTYSEIENKGFEILRSNNGITFDSVVLLPAAV